MCGRKSRLSRKSFSGFLFSLCFLLLCCFSSYAADHILTEAQYQQLTTALTESDKALQQAQERSIQQQATIEKLQQTTSNLADSNKKQQEISRQQADTLSRQERTLQQSANTLAGLAQELPTLSRSFDQAIEQEQAKTIKWQIAGSASTIVAAAAAGFALGGPVGAAIGAGIGSLIVLGVSLAR